MQAIGALRVFHATARVAMVLLAAAGVAASVDAVAVGVANAADVATIPQDPPVMPCDVPVDTSKGAWRLVDTEEVTFCLPVSWKLNKRRASSRGMTIEWRAGVMPVDRRKPFVVDAVVPGRPPMASGSGAGRARTLQEQRVTISGHAVHLKAESGNGNVQSTAVWTEPSFFFSGTARTEDEAISLWEIYRTARPKVAP